MLTFATLETRFRTEATSMYSLLRSLGISVGVSVDTTVIVRNTQINHAELVSHITPFSPAVRSLVPNLVNQGAQSAALLDNEVNRQAGMIAYTDLFQLSTYLLVAVIFLVPLVRVPKRGPAAEEPNVALEA